MLTIKVDGDAEGGWMTEIHDGANFKASSPEAETEWEAAGKAVAEFIKLYEIPMPVMPRPADPSADLPADQAHQPPTPDANPALPPPVDTAAEASPPA